MVGRKIPLFLMVLTFIASSHGKQLYEMTNREIDSLLTVISKRNLTITERINFYSEKFLGTPYNLRCVGDGPYALLENWPLVNFKETNCMAYCEHVLALSISDSWDNFFNNLQHIRYKDGIIGMRTRNHYTMADWLPENAWLLEHVSRKVGGKYTREVTRTISHIKFFKQKGIKDLRYVKPDRTITLDYVPKEVLKKVKKKVKPGDVLALIYANKADIFSAHMLIVAQRDGQLVIRESSNSKMTTFETPYDEWAEKVRNSCRYIGVCFMRVRDKLNKPGKVILPWEIKKMKK
ncbi:MAG: hypothetical protein DRP92_05315 [Candidatus Neomarinimicrobiota bacterium]|nr:MAG: hypothetical protein DRP92_05315 [Candidatus Neomarinimicrobiota bacterium]